ncbi:MAG: hypothetical protein ACLP50_24550 [Solirubrobacteraceae bacterium]
MSTSSAADNLAAILFVLAAENCRARSGEAVPQRSVASSANRDRGGCG